LWGKQRSLKRGMGMLMMFYRSQELITMLVNHTIRGSCEVCMTTVSQIPQTYTHKTPT
jgi:hypothetical protein